MVLKKSLLLFYFGILCMSYSLAATSLTDKNYQKKYYENGVLQAEGWHTGNAKTDYWYFYHANGTIAKKGSFRSNRKNGYWYYYSEDGELLKEGHYRDGITEGWWIFYDIATQTEKRFQHKNNQKNGYALIYKNNRLRRAEKYKNDSKIGEWTSVFSFKRDNPDVSL